MDFTACSLFCVCSCTFNSNLMCPLSSFAALLVINQRKTVKSGQRNVLNYFDQVELSWPGKGWIILTVDIPRPLPRTSCASLPCCSCIIAPRQSLKDGPISPQEEGELYILDEETDSNHRRPLMWRRTPSSSSSTALTQWRTALWTLDPLWGYKLACFLTVV